MDKTEYFYLDTDDEHIQAIKFESLNYLLLYTLEHISRDIKKLKSKTAETW